MRNEPFNNRPFRRGNGFYCALVLSGTLLALLSPLGCGKDSQQQVPQSSASTNSRLPSKTDNSTPTDESTSTADSTPTDESQNGSVIAKLQAVATDQSDEELSDLTQQIELACKNSDRELAVRLVASLDLTGSRFDQTAAQLLVEQAYENNAHAVAIAALEQMVKQSPGNVRWTHALWNLLSQSGRHWEASRYAQQLSRQGASSAPQLLSLIRRNETFPANKGGVQPSGFAAWPALKQARWFVSHGEFAKAETTLRPLLAGEPQDGEPQDTATAAIYLRVLAELQRTEQFCLVHSSGDAKLHDHADYWCAAGKFLLDQSEYEAAAGALLRAVKLDPTMRIAYQRLSRSMNSLNREDDAEQFRHLGLQVAATETIGRRISEQPSNRAAIGDLARLLLELDRPLEALEWTRLTIPTSDTQRLAVLAQRRNQIASDPNAATAASQMATMDLKVENFPYQKTLVTLTRTLAKNAVTTDTTQSPPKVIPRLENVAKERGADFQWYHSETIDLDTIPLYESVGGGLGVIDYDLDGWPDLYFAQGGGTPPTESASFSSELRRNLEGHFANVTASAVAQDFNYSSGIAVGDVNQDGFPDLFMGALGKNRLLINNGDGTFHDDTVNLGKHADRFTTSVAIADLNQDSIPDLFEVNYIAMDGAFARPNRNANGEYELTSPALFLPDADRMLLNDRGGQFQMIEVDTKVAKPATGLGIVITDFDGRAGNEIFVGNDLRENHYLRFSDGDFTNAAAISGVAAGLHGLANGCMGIATGDFDRNGTLDLHIGNYREESDNLFLQNDRGSFQDRSTAYGLRDNTMQFVTFGAKTLDFDRNGWLDLIVTNGHIFDMRAMNQGYKMSPNLMMSDGSNYASVQVVDQSGYWSGSYLGRTMVMTDFNRDGQTDFLIGHLQAPTALLENRTTADGNHIQLELIGTASERDATGAKVTVKTQSGTVAQWMAAGDGYFGSDECYLDLATGSDQKVDSVEVVWPSGQTSVLPDLKTNNRYLVIEGQTKPFARRLGERD